MPKKFIKRWMPDHEKIRKHPQLNKVFGKLLHDPNLLHLNRHSVSGAFFVGLLMAFVPLPTQMIFAAAAAILLRVNLPISVGLVWLTNPVTMPPVFYFCYKVGAWVLHRPVAQHHFEMTWTWVTTELASMWQPFLLGCLICGLTAATLGAGVIRLIWRIHVIRQWQARRASRRKIVKN